MNSELHSPIASNVKEWNERMKRDNNLSSYKWEINNAAKYVCYFTIFELNFHSWKILSSQKQKATDRMARSTDICPSVRNYFRKLSEGFQVESTFNKSSS